ncbi:MAG TPA: hypothetical protein VKT30_13730 [Caulobacteraceae bacterium]|nr:hypothetical protein [Caulobacteraceae bacterium]
MKLPLKALAAVGAIGLSATAGFATAQAFQPHMQNALRDLQAARSELSIAVPDKGGHRVAALNLVNQAIWQTRAGMGFADTH